MYTTRSILNRENNKYGINLDLSGLFQSEKGLSFIGSYLAMHQRLNIYK